MTKTITRIIDTDSLTDENFVSFKSDGAEFAGMFHGFNDAGEIDVKVAAMGGIVSVPHEAVTDIL